MTQFEPNAILRGAQLTLVGASRTEANATLNQANRALQNPGLFTSDHYRQAALAVAAGLAIRLIISIPILGVKGLLWFRTLFMETEGSTLDTDVVDGLHFLEHSVLQVPFFLMSLMRYITPTLDDMFMNSLQWVDQTYLQKHKTEDPRTLRSLFYPNLRMYPRGGPTATGDKKKPMEAIMAFLTRFGRRAGISLSVYALSYLPVVGRFVLPAASFYTFKKAVGLEPALVIFGSSIFLPKRYLVQFLQSYFSSRSLMRELLEPYFSRIRFTKEQKKAWFKDREGVLFGFGFGFFVFLKIPLLGVLIYGIAEASTAYLITKITDPPPPPAEAEATNFAESQIPWKNKHEFLSLPLANIDAANIDEKCQFLFGPSQRASIGFTRDDAYARAPGWRGNATPLGALLHSGVTNDIDLNKDAAEQPILHNRWHPDVPFVGKIKDGETVKIECVDWTGGQIKNNDSADDMKNVDLTKIHYLTGPFEIEGAEPGDVLLVEIADVQPLEEQPWGFTGVFDKNNGGGFLDELYPKAAKAIWDFEGIFCSSRHIPGVKFAGLIHPGILGCAPSAEVLAEWNRREGELIAAMDGCGRVVAQPPNPQNVHAGAATAEVKQKVGLEGARTIPGRPEHGGNCDIKNLSRGSKVYLPVHVKGAGFSVGDLHFSQGDGEISFCGAIEMPGVITIKFRLIKSSIDPNLLQIKSPMYQPGPVEPAFGPGRYIYFEGFSVDERGKQHYLDATVAYRQTCLRCIEYLRRYGYSDYQIYLLLSCAPVQGHLAGVVDIPNACTTMGLPMDIFDFDVSPEKPAVRRDMGSCAFTSDD
ncbi:formamidase [Phyllosticta citriasiana]|uniref:formamidase n=1 Tax=Phyllosticta citriasiana TaxID=595635 RepID=UPI0030FDAF9E